MALPADLTISVDAPPVRGSDITSQLNNLIDEVRVLRTALADLAAKYNATLVKLDADTGVTDTNYGATNTVVTTTFATDSTHKAHKLRRR